MQSTRSRRSALVAVAASAALGAATLVGVPAAGAAPAEEPSTGSLSSISAGTSPEDGESAGSTSGSIEDFFANEAVQAGGVLLVGLGVAAALAIGAGIQGGAFNDVQLPI